MTLFQPNVVIQGSLLEKGSYWQPQLLIQQPQNSDTQQQARSAEWPQATAPGRGGHSLPSPLLLVHALLFSRAKARAAKQLTEGPKPRSNASISKQTSRLTIARTETMNQKKSLLILLSRYPNWGLQNSVMTKKEWKQCPEMKAEQPVE